MSSKSRLRKRPVTKLADRPLAIEPLALRPAHAAQVLSISERTLWDWVKSGRLQIVKPSPGIVLVLMTSIKKLLEVPSPAE
jgi:hypothetical protein